MSDSDQSYTDKKLLVKGLKRLALAIPLIVLTTYVLTFAFLNKESIPIYVFLIPGVLLMGCSIYVIFKGIRLVIQAVFN